MSNKYLSATDAKLVVGKWISQPSWEIPKNIKNCRKLLEVCAKNPKDYLRRFIRCTDLVSDIFCDVVYLEYSLEKIPFSEFGGDEKWELIIWNIKFASNKNRLDSLPYKTKYLQFFLEYETGLIFKIYNLNAAIGFLNIEFVSQDNPCYKKYINKPKIVKVNSDDHI